MGEVDQGKCSHIHGNLVVVFSCPLAWLGVPIGSVQNVGQRPPIGSTELFQSDQK